MTTDELMKKALEDFQLHCRLSGERFDVGEAEGFKAGWKAALRLGKQRPPDVSEAAAKVLRRAEDLWSRRDNLSAEEVRFLQDVNSIELKHLRAPNEPR